MVSEQTSKLLKDLLTFEDAATGVEIVHTAEEYVEFADRYVANGSFLKDGQTVGKLILEIRGGDSAFEFSVVSMDDAISGQGLGTRYCAFVENGLSKAGIKYAFARHLSEPATRVLESFKWGEPPKELARLDLPDDSLAIDLSP